MKYYKKAQIIKHALESYTQNKTYTSDTERKQDQQVLDEIRNEVVVMKEKYGIQLSPVELDFKQKQWR
ncbi:hypothetical protein [Aerococcus sp. 1KP-2016]|uniref:hypothetical protein n=1 Tax=Aerococcus sp. 1KP-2016 TaxID=1981982 RepID=UPI000B99843C|nr:hypothetical protein [Aerococcus sp. 1KP-2016]OYQ68284.1 hypothetical protein B9P78_00300 [Aerococcus sp. 1KP-2016]